ncbi:hypothetical protein [Pseudarthrobacter sulfonivorans]|uniref:hypothetical protein n=1 Tax=Pseudarthrobacter sulfonivorans TaxID=121292 RepID=UPI0028567957|nr:hypothetical protein [Pseudarthrobacter sulfonivorans]MDR6416236.1 hypothetical protein [Pseudarthrobacter sulfonivorans]
MSNPQGPHQPVQPAHRPQQPQQEPQAQTQAGQNGVPGQFTAPGQYPAQGQYAAPGQHGAPGPYDAAGQAPADGPFGLPGEQPPARGRRRLLIILGVVGGVLLLVILGVVILINVVAGPTNHARGLADDFTKLVINGETSTAYDKYLDPALQEQVSKEAFIAGIKTLEMDNTCKPTYNNVNAATENGTKAADVVGLITCDGGKNIDLVYRFEGTDELKMMDIKIKPQV